MHQAVGYVCTLSGEKVAYLFGRGTPKKYRLTLHVLCRFNLQLRQTNQPKEPTTPVAGGTDGNLGKDGNSKSKKHRNRVEQAFFCLIRPTALASRRVDDSTYYCVLAQCDAQY